MLKLRPHISSGERTRTLLLLAAVVFVTSPLAVTTSAPALSVEPSLEEEEELEGRAPTVVELSPGVEAAFPRESYAPQSTATLTVYNRARGLRLQIFHAGPEGTRTVDNVTMNGVAITKVVGVGASSGRGSLRIRIGAWPPASTSRG